MMINNDGGLLVYINRFFNRIYLHSTMDPIPIPLFEEMDIDDASPL